MALKMRRRARWLVAAGYVLAIAAIGATGLFYWISLPKATPSDGFVSIALAQAGEPQELVELRTRTSKTTWLGVNAEGYPRYALDVSIGSMHYRDDPDDPNEMWKVIDTTIVASDRPNWDWEVTKGHWTLLVNSDTTVAVGKDGHWIGFKYRGVGYLDWQSKDYEILFTPVAVTPVVSGQTITWPNIFPNVDLRYTYGNDGFKEELIVHQAARDWLEAHPPSDYGLSNVTSYLGGYIECDWQQSYAGERNDGSNVDWDDVQEFTTDSVSFRHPVKDYLVSALPLGFVYHGAVVEAEPIRQRYWRQGDTHYLLFGAKVSSLNQYPGGDLIFDPSVDEQVGAGTDDCTTYSTSINLGASLIWMVDEVYVTNTYVRFTTVAIPAGATIDNAYVDYCAYDTSVETTTVRLQFIKEADTATFSTQADADGRALTTNYVDWSPSAWIVDVWYGYTNDQQDTGDSLQEVIDLGGWSSGNALAMRASAQAIGTTERNAYTYEYDSSYAAKLHVDYTVGACSENISNTPSSKAFGVVQTSSTYWSNGSEPTWPVDSGDAYFDVTNNSGGSIKVQVKATNFTGGVGWTISNSTAEDTVVLSVFENGDGSGDGLVVTTSYQDWMTGVSSNSTVPWELKFETATSHTDGAAKTSTLTLNAVCE